MSSLDLVEDESVSSCEDLPWHRNPHVCWRHPVARMAVPVLILVGDFYIYAEDPVQDSHVEYAFPGFGHIYNLFYGLFLDCGVWLLLLRLALIAVTLVLGTLFSMKYVHNKLLRDTCKLHMFSDNDGSWFVASLIVPVFLMIPCVVFNLFVPEDSTCHISPNTRLTFSTWGKIFQQWSAFLDVVSIVMIFDAVLQDEKTYPDWCPRLKATWKHACGGYLRIVAVWGTVALMLVLIHQGVMRVGNEKGQFAWDNLTWISQLFGGWSKLGRTVFLNVVIFCDLFTVMQDWDFPKFKQAMNVNIAGTFVQEINCKCLENIHPSFRFRITGPWLTYGPLLFVLAADLACAKTQFTYRPWNFGQYADMSKEFNGRVWTIQDSAYLELAYKEGVLQNRSMLDYFARHNASTGEALDNSSRTDVMQNTVFRQRDTKIAAACIVPGIVFILGFIAIVYVGDRSVKAAEEEVLQELHELATVCHCDGGQELSGSEDDEDNDVSGNM